MSDSLHFLSILDASRLIAARKLSPVELTQAFLARISSCNETLNAYLTITAEQAVKEAKEAESAQMSGRLKGPLHGIPFALKDIYDTRGVRTTGQSRIFAERVPVADAACYERLRDAGAILLGKLTTHELATGGPAYDLPWPPAKNPWLLNRFPGGSSSGAGAAVAAGLSPCALGSDTGGSIRLPAAYCGIAGLKPSFGRVSRRGVLPLSWTLDHCGPMAWTVADCGALLQTIAGHDPRDPCSSTREVPHFNASLDAGVQGLKIGVLRQFYADDAGTAPEVARAMDDAIATLAGCGARVRDVAAPPLADFQACYRFIVASEAFTAYASKLRDNPQLFSAATRYRILPGALIAASDYVNALRFQRLLATQTRKVFDDVDVVISATTTSPAPVQQTMSAHSTLKKPPLTIPFNVAQLPAISVCNGFSANGLPLGMQIAGRPYDEETVLRVANTYEKETDWRRNRPGLLVDDAQEHVEKTRAAEATVTTDEHYARCAQLAHDAGLNANDEILSELCQMLPEFENMAKRLPYNQSLEHLPSVTYND